MTPLLLLQQALKQRRLKYNPDQPRVPAGSPDGGQWTDGGSTDGPVPGGMSSADALTDYQNYAYARINETLRLGNDLDEKGKQYVAMIDKALEEQPVQSVNVWRGDGGGISVTLFEHEPLPNDFLVRRQDLHTPTGREAVRLLNDKYVGKVFRDNAYVSTSSSEHVTLDKFVSGSLEVTRFGAVGLVEIVGKSKAIDMDKMTGLVTEEQEQLLPRTTAFKIERVDIKPHPDGERLYLHWKVRVQ